MPLFSNTTNGHIRTPLAVCEINLWSYSLNTLNQLCSPCLELILVHISVHYVVVRWCFLCFFLHIWKNLWGINGTQVFCMVQSSFLLTSHHCQHAEGTQTCHGTGIILSWCTVQPLVTRWHIYWTPSCHSRHFLEERICGRHTADNTTCHRCHLWLVQERSPSPDHKPGINFLHLFTKRTLS